MAAAVFKEILYAVDGPSAVITLNRPAQLNAWTDTMGNEVRQAFHQAESDSRVIGIILTGAERAFCSGADLSLLDKITQNGKLDATNSDMPGDTDFSADYRQTYSYIASIRKPVIAAMHGACVGMAVPISLFCDLRFATPKAFFMTAFSQRGLIAEWGSSWLLPRIIGNANALDMLLSSRRVYAEEAKQMGLINRVVEHENLLSEAKAYINDLAQNCSPRSMAIIKRQLYQDWMNSFDSAQQTALKLMKDSFSSEDFKEGVASILAKR
ncbi:MAG: enoyl-CoA hydratase/carnithine racemase, partial [Oceanicoccus sp.]